MREAVKAQAPADDAPRISIEVSPEGAVLLLLSPGGGPPAVLGFDPPTARGIAKSLLEAAHDAEARTRRIIVPGMM